MEKKCTKLKYRRLIIFAVVLISCFSAINIFAVTSLGANNAQLFESYPEVYIANLALDTSEYSAGDTINGSFDLINAKDVAVSNLSYQVFLVGGLGSNNLYKDEFDNQVLGITFLDKKETKKIEFVYKLPESSIAYSSQEQLGIKIRAFTGAGLPLGWSDVQISIADFGLTPIIVNRVMVVVGGREYYVNSNPIVYPPDDKIQLKLSLENKTNENIIDLTPQVSIFGTNYASDPLVNYSEKNFSISAKSKKELVFDLPLFNYVPRIYVGKLVINDKNDISRVQPIKFRYAVYGPIVNILNTQIDRFSVKRGEKFNFKFDYSCSSFDIISPDSLLDEPLDFSVRLFGENKNLVVEYSDKIAFTNYGFKNIELTAGRSAKKLSAEVIVLKDGKVITEYKTNFPAGKSTWVDFRIVVILLIGIIILSSCIVIFLKFKK